MTVRVRFAPSPTGEIHIGNIRSAIFNWLFARREGGRFLLRIEDTDRERATTDAVDIILDVMRWLGLDYDEEPFYQSVRLNVHVSMAESLVRKGVAYREDKGNTGKGECIIFRMPNEDVSYHDEIKGELTKKAEDLKDFVLLRSDGTPTFHLANVADDIQMAVTHIIRGDDHVENTFKHICIYKALGAPLPKYGHLPMVVNQQGKPYSKRDGECFVGEFRDKGFDPAALFNYLALLGWSPGDDREKLSRAEMIELFSLERVKSSPAQMDLKKLAHLNAEYIAELPLETFLAHAKTVLKDKAWLDGVGDDHFRAVCSLMQSRTHLYSYVEDWVYFFSNEFPYDEKPVRKVLGKPGVRDALGVLAERLKDIEFAQEDLEKVIRDVEKACDVREGKLNQAIRVAVTGRSTGAGIYETMALLGKFNVISRLSGLPQGSGA